jgi:hypothetical protein
MVKKGELRVHGECLVRSRSPCDRCGLASEARLGCISRRYWGSFDTCATTNLSLDAGKGREINPADAFRKQQRAKELQKNKKERQMTREAFSHRCEAESAGQGSIQSSSLQHAPQRRGPRRWRSPVKRRHCARPPAGQTPSFCASSCWRCSTWSAPAR